MIPASLRPQAMQVQTRALVLDDLVSQARPGGYAWFHAEMEMVGWGEAMRFDAGIGPERFARAALWLETAFESLGSDDLVAFGSFTFDDDTPGSSVIIPRVLLRSRDGIRTITSVGEDSEPEFQGSLAQAHDGGLTIRDVDPAPWKRTVELARYAIRRHEMQKVVLARTIPVTSDEQFQVARVIRQLVDTYPNCYTFAFDGLVGASPELLIQRRGIEIGSIPIAGSAPRGITAHDDEILGIDLLRSKKNRWEHDLAVQSVMRALRPLCSSLSSDEEPWLMRLSNVTHLATRISGYLIDRLTSLDLAGALHPTAAVCGVPTEVAMQTIRRLEDFDRDRYAGPIGWMDPSGDGEWAIALRCAQISGSEATVYVGSGIVADSDPEVELVETMLKAEAILQALR